MLTWYDVRPILENNTYTGNNATYGPDIASYAIALRALDEENNAIDVERKLDDSGNELSTATSLETVASGQVIGQELKIGLIDHLG